MFRSKKDTDLELYTIFIDNVVISIVFKVKMNTDFFRVYIKEGYSSGNVLVNGIHQGFFARVSANKIAGRINAAGCEVQDSRRLRLLL